MNIFVTGATGFIGSLFVKKILDAEPGLNVKCGVRASSDRSVLQGRDVEYVHFDLSDESTYAPALSGIDTVIHFAALYDFHAPGELLMEYNAIASEKLAVAAYHAGVSHYVYCSSTEALGIVEDADEDAAFNFDNEYGKSKARAETLLLSVGERTGLPLTIARPTGVIGAGRCYPFNDVIIATDRGLMSVVPGPATGFIHWTAVEDIADGFVRIVQKRDISSGKIYNLASDTPQSWIECIQVICRVLGKHPPRIHVPPAFAKAGVSLLSLIYPKLGESNFVLRPGNVEKMQTSRSYRNSMARKDLEWRPRVSFQAGVESCVAWLRQRGMITP